MTNGIRIGVVGATGQVGAVVRRLLEERDFPVAEIRYFASERSAGTTLPWKGEQVVIEDAATRRPDRGSTSRSSPPGPRCPRCRPRASQQ